MSDEEPLTLGALVEAVAGELEGVTARSVPGGVELLRGTRLFAALCRGTLSVPLGGALARAAVRTPDAVAGVEGEGWVDFRPPVLDRYAEDRARSWLEAAWRRAE